MARSKKNKTSIGCLFWIALILLILVIFLFNRETIQTVIEETGFIEILKNNRNEKEPEIEIITPDEESENTAEQLPSEENQPDSDSDPEGTDNTTSEEETIVTIEVEADQNPPEETAAEEILEPDKKVRRSKLYFIEISETEEISLKGIVRPVYFEDSPLTQTIKTLLDGLSSSELNMGLISLIPENTKLLSVNLKDGVAYLNFSDSFRFNKFGKEGYIAQLKQIVYTATEFSTIKSVQILIDGAKSEYMGPEGVFIGKPLSRNDF